METKRVWFQWFQTEWLSGLVPSFGSAYGSDNLWVYHFCAYLTSFRCVCAWYGSLCLPWIWSWSRTRRVPWCSLANIKGRSRRPAFSGKTFSYKKKLSLRARNLDVEPIKVNDTVILFS